MLLRCRIENAAMHLPKLGGTLMWTAKRFKSQAATCAVLAKKTHDEDSRLRYLRLEQMYPSAGSAKPNGYSEGAKAGR